MHDPCPPLAPLSDNTIAALVSADVETAVLYAQCQAKHKAAIEAYDQTRQSIIDENSK